MRVIARLLILSLILALFTINISSAIASTEVNNTPQEAIETAVWKCEHCGFIHSKETDLPLSATTKI